MLKDINEITQQLRGTELISDNFSRKNIFTLFAHYRSKGEFEVIVKNAREVSAKLFTIIDLNFTYEIHANYMPSVWWVSALVKCDGDYVETIESVSGNPESLVHKMVDMLKTYYVSNKEEFEEQIQSSGWWKIS